MLTTAGCAMYGKQSVLTFHSTQQSRKAASELKSVPCGPSLRASMVNLALHAHQVQATVASKVQCCSLREFHTKESLHQPLAPFDPAITGL
jgi:hypothetical protein